MTLAIDVLLIAACAAVVTDLRSRKIPNALSIAVALFALGLAAAHGAIAFLVCFATIVGVLIAGTFAFSSGWLGGGDVKFMAAVAGALGPAQTIDFLIYTSLAGGAIAVALSAATGRLPATFRSVGNLLRPLAIEGTVAIAPARPIVMPYALAIAGGVTMVALSHSIAPFLRLPL